jgi:hypothetical protein
MTHLCIIYLNARDTTLQLAKCGMGRMPELDTVRQPLIICLNLSLHHLVEFRILNGLTS